MLPQGYRSRQCVTEDQMSNVTGQQQDEFAAVIVVRLDEEPMHKLVSSYFIRFVALKLMCCLAGPAAAQRTLQL